MLCIPGHRTLLIEGDPQGSMSKQLGFDINQPLTHIGNLMERLAKGQPTRIREAVVPIYDQGMLDLIPADITLSNVESWMIGAMNREHLFARLMEKESDFFKQYDVVIIDSAPNTSILTTSFLVASKLVTAVVMPEAQSVLAIEGWNPTSKKLTDHTQTASTRSAFTLLRTDTGSRTRATSKQSKARYRLRQVHERHDSARFCRIPAGNRPR
jgi:cellulose biosynthesis protein BcsQ